MEKELSATISDQLKHMAEVDQEMRNRATRGEAWDNSVDVENTKRLRAIIEEYGWPTISKFGIEASQAAWLIAQHADQDADFQSYCLQLMKKENQDEVTPSHVAYLEDRVRVNQGKPQLYGTQFFGAGDELKPRPIEDKAHLNERRAKVGLGLFEEYKKQMEEIDRCS